MAKNRQFNFRVPSEVKEEFSAKVQELKKLGAKIEKLGVAAQAAMIMWARADRNTQLDWLKTIRNYDLDAARANGPGTAGDAEAFVDDAVDSETRAARKRKRPKKRRA